MTIVWAVASFIIGAFAAIGFCLWWYGLDRLGEILAALQNDPNAAFNGVLISQIYVASAVAQIAVIAVVVAMRGWPITSYLALDLPEPREVLKYLAILIALIV